MSETAPVCPPISVSTLFFLNKMLGQVMQVCFCAILTLLSVICQYQHNFMNYSYFVQDNCDLIFSYNTMPNIS